VKTSNQIWAGLLAAFSAFLLARLFCSMSLETLFIIILAILLGVSLFYNWRLLGYVRLLQSALRHTASQMPRFILIGAALGFLARGIVQNLRDGEGGE
jgi:hypothetical protein